MGISRTAFESGNFKRKSTADKRSKHPIIVFLRKNHRNAFTVSEICKAINMREDTVRGMLSTLRKDNLVEHNTPYFIAVVKKSGSTKKKAKKTAKKRR